MNLSTALAKPSSELEVVTRPGRALHLEAGVAHRDAQPECANISTSFAASPIVAMASGRIPYRADR